MTYDVAGAELMLTFDVGFHFDAQIVNRQKTVFIGGQGFGTGGESEAPVGHALSQKPSIRTSGDAVSCAAEQSCATVKAPVRGSGSGSTVPLTLRWAIIRKLPSAFYVTTPTPASGAKGAPGRMEWPA